MKHVKLLDCTLRDGAYLIDKEFGDTTIRGIISGLLKTGIDFIEIGFFQNEGFGEGKTVYLNSKDAGRFVPADKHNSLFTVLADYSRYNVENLDFCDGTSVDAIRECFFKHERFDALEACRVIKQKGYKLFVQPVDILGYSDSELEEFINLVNEVEPYCISIVDTFGSMYQEDLQRVFEIVDHNLNPSCRIGFHSHNNMQLSNALSQEFVRISEGRREVVIDGTLNGMGRGAGNTPTELIVQYLNSHRDYNYNLDSLLDVIDDYMNNIRSKCSWGYSTPFFVAGSYSAHVNNISHLMEKNSMRSRSLRMVLDAIGAEARKRYDFDLLDKTYSELLQSDVDDSGALEKLSETLDKRKILLVAPGTTSTSEKNIIKKYIADMNPIVIYVNFLDEEIEADYVYMSNIRRYEYWKNSERYLEKKRIVLSSIKTGPDSADEYIISFNNLVKCGWKHMDNALILLLRLLDRFDVESIAVAGFDGYSFGKDYGSTEMELSTVHENPIEINREITEMICDYMKTRARKVEVRTITTSRFSSCFQEE